jgi:multiple sugar transport system ATP-binding protein
MNIFHGKIEIKDNKPAFILGDGTSITLSNPNLSSYADKDMVLGIRPEHLSIDGNDNSIPATVDVVEPLGDRKDVYLTAGNKQKFIANIDPHIDIAMGQQIKISVNLDKIHIFEPGDAGKNITLNQNNKQ